MRKSYLFLTSVLLISAFFVLTQCNKKNPETLENNNLFNDRLNVYKIMDLNNSLTVNLVLKKIILVPEKKGFGMSPSPTDVYKIVDADDNIYQFKANVAIGGDIQTNLSSKIGFRIYYNTNLLYTHK